MGRAPCCDKTKVKRGPWSPEEDAILTGFLEKHGTASNWIALPHKAGLKRCGKSCRLRWLNYLRPDIKHGGFTEEEDSIICSLFNSIGSRWSIIASQLPGRTDNDVKNYWNTKLKRKLLAGKVSLNSSNNKDLTPNDISHLISPTQTSISNIPCKVEACEHGSSSTNFNANPGTWQNEMDMFCNYHQNLDLPEEILLDPSFQVPFPGLMEVSDYSTSGHNMNYSKSSSQEASNLSISSSSPLTLETNCVSWFANGNAHEEEASLPDFIFEPPCGLLQGFEFQKTSNEEVAISKLIN